MRDTNKPTGLGKLIAKALTDKNMARTQPAGTVRTSPQCLSCVLYGTRSGEEYIPTIIAVLELDPRKVEKAVVA